MLFFDRRIVVAKLYHHARAPEKGEKGGQESSQRTGSGQLSREQNTKETKADQDKNDVSGVDPENLADDGGNFIEILAVTKHRGQNEIRCSDDEVQRAGKLDGVDEHSIHGRAWMIWRKGTITPTTKDGGKSAKMGSVTTVRAKVCPRQPPVRPSLSPQAVRSKSIAAPWRTK